MTPFELAEAAEAMAAEIGPEPEAGGWSPELEYWAACLQRAAERLADLADYDAASLRWAAGPYKRQRPGRWVCVLAALVAERR